MRTQEALSIGSQFGRLTVMGEPESKTQSESKRFYPCSCSCGGSTTVRRDRLREGDKGTKSCGCLQSRYKHGLGGTLIYALWNTMLRRCENPADKKYPSYGQRGIKVCEAWHNVETFNQWATSNGYAPGLQIDRRDNNGNYEPGNCRWVTRKVNANNRRNTAYLTAFSETKPVKDWLTDPRCKATQSALKWRLSQGYESERALTQELQIHRVF